MHRIISLLTCVLMIIAIQLAYAAALPEQKVNSKVSSESSKELSKPQTDKKSEQSVKVRTSKKAKKEKEEAKTEKEEVKTEKMYKSVPTHCPDPPCK